jgi:hypothetical protein
MMTNPGAMMTEPVQTNDVIVSEYPVGPIESDVQIQQRPIISTPVVDSTKQGDQLLVVPGPESGPIPGN